MKTNIKKINTIGCTPNDRALVRLIHSDLGWSFGLNGN